MKPAPRPIILLLLALLAISACTSSTVEPTLERSSAQALGAASNSHWHCEGRQDSQWRCLDLDTGKTLEPALPEPLAPPAATAATNEAITTAKAINTTNPAEPAQLNTASDYAHPLLAQPGNAVVIQLLAARSPQTIVDFQARYPQLHTQPVTINKNGEKWQLLLLGPFATLSEAKNAIRAIDPPLNETPWIRTVSSIVPYLVY